MLDNIKIYTSDEYWKHILTDLGANVVDTPNVADVVFDNDGMGGPVSVDKLRNLILTQFNSNDIIYNIFGQDVILSDLQRKIVITLYKKPDIQMRELKSAVGVMAGMTTHSVENAVYQLRKKFGHDFILNRNGGYKIGRI